MQSWRKSTQPLAPVSYRPPLPAGQYDAYPAFSIGPGKIRRGCPALAAALAGHKIVTLDGYAGVLWPQLRAQLDLALAELGIRARWIDVSTAWRPEAEIERLIGPFLGDDPVFGIRFTGHLRDFFDPRQLQHLRPQLAADMNIIYGSGAALAGWEGLLVYVDVPKNEIQYRARAGSVCNLATRQPRSSKAMYKRFYFVDWIVLNAHKADLLSRIDLIVDGQRPDEPLAMTGTELRAGLAEMSQSYFRPRPWFEPGPWGGQWIKRHIPQASQDTQNYAWSFELIAPENGLMFESDGLLLEVSFDCLMYHAHDAVLGSAAEQFGYDFPIRFDFLDTFDGGNLSVQCHPRPDYVRTHFGERFTQDEAYYILDCGLGARVYLGFRDGVNASALRIDLERSARQGLPVDVDRYVQRLPVRKHDLFLIPHGTIHCSGKDNLVLEISATPYIYTFKMYDWLRPDLDNMPRVLHIDRAFDNLNFERHGKRVRKELVSRPHVQQQGGGWRLLHLPTHRDHFYDVHRLEFTVPVDVGTDGACHVMNVVEGQSVILEIGDHRQRFNYAETFVVPAGAGRYRLISEGQAPAKVVRASVNIGKLGTTGL